MHMHSSPVHGQRGASTRAALHRKASGLAHMIIELHEGGLTPAELHAVLAARLQATCDDAVSLVRSLLQSALHSLRNMVLGNQRTVIRRRAEVHSQQLGQALTLLGIAA